MSRIIRVSAGVFSRRTATRVLAAAGVIGVLVGAVWSAFPAPALALGPSGINKQINFQGKVTNSDGTNVADGNYSFVFSLYNAASGGSAMWTETVTLAVTAGIFQYDLGSDAGNPLPGSVDFNSDSIYLGMAFNGDPEMSPRIRFTAAPYAFNSDALQGLHASDFAQLNPASAQSGSLNVTGNVAAGTSLQSPLVDNTGTLGLGTGSATTAVTVGRAVSTASLTLQGSAASSWTVTGASGSTTLNFAAPTTTNTITFPNAGGTVCTTVASTCSATYQAASATGYILKNAQDTTSASVATSALLAIQNTDTGTGRALDLTSAGTGSTLLVTANGNPGAGAAVIKVNSAAASPSGNLMDLQVGGVSKFSVSVAGVLTVAGGQTQDITTPSANTATGLIMQPGTSTGASSNGATIKIKGGDASGTTSVTGGDLTLQAGNATGASGTRNGGSVFIDGGTGFNSWGSVNIGTVGSANKTINVGNSGLTTGTQTINIGNQTSGGGTTNVVLGAGSGATAGDTTVQAKGTLTLNGTSVLDNGITTVQPAANSAAFNVIAGIGGGSVLKVDTSGSRVGVNLGAGSFSLGATTVGLEVNGALHLGGGVGSNYMDSVITPGGASVLTKIGIPITDLTTNYSQVLLFGVGSGSAATARGISVVDARTVAHQPSINVFSPNENQVFGLSWDGSNTTGTVKSSANNVSIQGNGVNILNAQNQAGVAAVGIGMTPAYALDVNGDANVASGKTYRINGQSINTGGVLTNVAYLDQNNTFTGQAIFSGVATDITTGANENLTLGPNGTGQIVLSSATQLATLGTADSSTFLCRNSLNQIASCTGGSANSFVQGGNSFGATAVLGTKDNYDLQIMTNNTNQWTFTNTGDLKVVSATANFDMSASVGTFKTGTGAVSLNGATTVTGDLTFASGVATRTLSVASAASAGVTGTNLTVQAGGALSGNANGGALTLQAGTATGTGTGGTTTIRGGTASTTGAGGGIQVLAASGGSAAASGLGPGGSIMLQAGSAAGSNQNDGGSITLTAGTAAGGGTPGTVNIGTPVFTSVNETFTQTGNNQTFTSITDPALQTNLDTYGTIVVNVTGAYTGATVTMPAPSNTAAGRVIYVSAATGSAAFTLAATGMSSVNMSAGNTATLVWNGSGWSGTTTASSLQQVYNNTSTSPASIITTSATKNILFQAGLGSDNANVFQIGNSLAAPVLHVDTTNTATGANIANNSGAESGSGCSLTGWSAYTGTVTPTVCQNTNASNLASGAGSVDVHFASAGTGGVNNDLSGTALATSQIYNVSFNIKAGTSAPTNANLIVEYYKNNTDVTPDATCTTPDNGSITTTGFFKWTCYFTTSATAKATTNLIRIRQADSVARDLYIDNLFVGAQSSSGSLNSGELQVGGPLSQGLTLFQLDSFANDPVAGAVNQNMLGSMYYSTTLGRIQCYEKDGWGSCGAAPDSNLFLEPEYAGAVLAPVTYNGEASNTHIGTMTANICSYKKGIEPTENGSLCASPNEEYNYYKWTTSQVSSQSYSIFVKYQLPPTFGGFMDSNTVKMVGRVSSTTDAAVYYTMFDASGNECGGTGSRTLVSTSANAWNNVSLSADETACGLNPGDIITFEVDMYSKNNAYAYAGQLNFTMKGK